jgi:outer membrane protein TolC
VKQRFLIPVIIFTFLSIPLTGFAQDSKAFDILNGEIETMLPPLETMIDSALSNSPYVKFRDLQIDVNEYKLKADRALWMKNLGIQTDVRYGTFDNFSTNTAEGQNPALIATRSNQLNYGAGAYIKLPLYDFMNRKNQIRLARAEVDQAQSLSLVQRNEVRQLVIKQYNDLLIKSRILKIKLKYAETSKINMEMVEKEFLNGIIAVSEYARISESVSRTETDIETAKIEFRTAYMILEEIVGVKFNRTKKLNQ